MSSAENVSMEETNQGTLLLEATFAPADTAYPTDLTLLNEGMGLSKLRKALGKQLAYVARNLPHGNCK